jgi:DHA1 family bicyclomycin/chloramphenicol resistance-like MFS transporter
VVRDLFDRTQMARVLALIAAAVTLSPALGPILGGFLHVWFGWRANFVALTGFGLALFTATLLLLDETNRFRDPSAIEPRRILGAYATLLGHPLYLGYLLAGAAIFAGLLFAWIAGAPFLFINLLGMAPEHYGLVSLITTGAYLAGTLLVAHGRLGLTADGMVLAGAGLTILGGGTMALAGVAGWFNAPAILLPMALFSVGMGLSLPNCMAAGMAPFPRLAGSASAMMGFGQMAFAALATVAIAVLQTGSAIPMGAIITAAGVVSLASFFVLIRPYRHNKPPPTGDRA